MMNKLIKTSSISAKSIGHYKLNEFTTQHGALIFDNSRGGNISNSYMYRVGFEKFGHIDIYLDKSTRLINSVWFVFLKSEILYQDDKLVFGLNNDFCIPFFDTSIWDIDDQNLWPRLENDSPIEVSHNNKDLLCVTFGEKHSFDLVSDEIQVQYDRDNALVGFMVKNKIEIPKLIQLLKS